MGKIPCLYIRIHNTVGFVTDLLCCEQIEIRPVAESAKKQLKEEEANEREQNRDKKENSLL